MTQPREACPTCKRPLGPSKPARVCADCGKPILHGHKWLWVTRKGMSTIVHRNCDDPQSYKPKADE